MTIAISHTNDVSIQYFSKAQIGDILKKQTFRFASYLTDPICRAHELFRQMYVIDVLNPTACKIRNWTRKFFIGIGIIASSFLSMGTTVPGVCLRALASHLEKEPFIYYQGTLSEKQVEGGFSLLSWNICCVGGGYAISDGGVMPWRYRIDKIIENIVSLDADIISLYEVLDTSAGFYLYEKLQEKYTHFYFNIGPRAIGTSSGIFIASKLKVTNPEFSPFPKHMLVGRTKNSEKGVFSFNIRAKENIKVYATHLQHSEEPQYATDAEEQARKKEMQLIMEKVDQDTSSVIVTGDLNLDNREYAQSSWAENFQETSFNENSAKTWDGDAFCAKMVGKRASVSLNLDYTLIAKKSALHGKTALIATGYDYTTFTVQALSDHKGLFSVIEVNKT